MSQVTVYINLSDIYQPTIGLKVGIFENHTCHLSLFSVCTSGGRCSAGKEREMEILERVTFKTVLSMKLICVILPCIYVAS